jgi:hypothetical protein
MAQTTPEATISIDTDAKSDDASAAFAEQLDALRTAETRQRERAEQAAKGPPVLGAEQREAIIKQWEQQNGGLSTEQAAFLRDGNQRMVDNPGLLSAATRFARTHKHPEGSDEFFSATKDYFDRMGLDVVDHNLPLLPDTKSRKAKPVKSESEDWDAPSDRSIVSAPVSREWGTTSASGSVNGDRPGVVRLSAAQKEMARHSGISEADYARGVLRLRKEKEDGLHQ